MAKRRLNGEGTVQKRKDGRYMVTHSAGHNERGKLIRKTVYGKTYEEAQVKGDELKRQIKLGLIIDKKMTFEDWADKWYEDFDGSVSKTTYESYGYTLRQVKKLLGKKSLVSIKAMDIERALNKLIAEGYSQSQVSKVKAMMGQIFRKAEANDMIEKNPVPLTEKIKMSKKATNKDSFTVDELETMYSELANDCIGHAIRLCLACGLRSQELLALEKEHISEDGDFLYIRQALKQVGGQIEIGTTKSLSGVRDIPVPAFANESARYLRDQTEGFVMQGKFDLPITPSTWRKKYKKALECLENVRYLPPHCCRHTYITMLHASGVDFDTVQTLAGQTDDDATRGYMHIKTDVTTRAVGMLEKTLSGRLEKLPEKEKLEVS